MEDSGAAGWDESAAAWIARVDEGDPSRVFLLDPVVLELCGSVLGLAALDVGCGEGRFSRKLTALGAHVVGLDPCRRLVEAAHHRDRQGFYLQALADHIPLVDASVDLVVCYLVLLDIADYRTAVREMARVLRPGGRIVCANIISFRTAYDPPWIVDDHGNKLYVPVNNYFGERALRAEWCGISVTNYHRPLEAYMSAFIDAGLRLAAYREPVPDQEAVARHPSFESATRVPFFEVVAWDKPTE